MGIAPDVLLTFAPPLGVQQRLEQARLAFFAPLTTSETTKNRRYMLEQFSIHDDIAGFYRENGCVVLTDLHSDDEVVRAREERLWDASPSRADAEAVFAAGDGR